MKLDPFITTFGLTVEQQSKIQKYSSPDNETSLLKRVPLSEAKEMTRLCSIVSGSKVRIKYRGPRRGSDCTKKADATSVTIYIKNEY